MQYECLVNLQVSDLHLYDKDTLTLVFSCDILQNFKNIFFTKHFRVTASV